MITVTGVKVYALRGDECSIQVEAINAKGQKIIGNCQRVVRACVKVATHNIIAELTRTEKSCQS